MIDFANTSPYHIHETGPGPLQAQCRGDSCRQGREPCVHPHLCLDDESMERVSYIPGTRKRPAEIVAEVVGWPLAALAIYGLFKLAQWGMQ